MKKKLVASLAAAMILGVAGTSFAASNPFVDVPAKHWSYDAVTKLATAGIVDGYGDGTFKGDKTISRYEMAQIVAKAMAHSDKATAEQKASIDKLAVEFASELEGLNVRVTKLEKNSSTVKITGYSRIRFQDTTDKASNGTEAQASKNLVLRTRLFATGQINDQWTYAGRLESNNTLYSPSSTDTDDVVVNSAYVTGPLLNTTAAIGRFDITPIYGYVMDDSLKGAKFSFGNALKTNLYYGKLVDAGTSTLTTFNDTDSNKTDKDITLTGADLKFGLSKATNLVGGFWQYDSNRLDAKRNIWEAGFDTKLTSNLVLKAEYIKSDEDSENKAYVAGFAYKAANAKKVGSYSIWANYRNFDANVAVDNLSTLDNALLSTKGGKGYEVGYNYVPALNTILAVKYVDTKADGTVGDYKAKFIRAQAEFFF